MKLFVDGKQVGVGKIAATCPLAYSLSGDGLSCGRDTLTPVKRDYRSEYVFTGTIRRVIADVGNDQKPMPKTPERSSSAECNSLAGRASDGLICPSLAQCG